MHLLKDLKSRGYRIHLYFLWVDNVDIALERVADRVRRGGHNVSEEIVRRRFSRGLPNLFNFYRSLLDFWAIFDNSTDHPVMVASEEDGELEIIDPVLFSKLSKDMESS